MKYLISLFVFLISLSAINCSKDSVAEQLGEDPKAQPVKVMQLHPKEFQQYLQLTGTLKAKSQVDIIVEEGGILQNILRDKGHYVRKNDTLAVLNNPMISAGYREARAGLNQARLDFDGKKILYNKKAISENEFLSAKYGLERARAQYDLAKARYLKLFIVSPINGYINNRFYDIGAYAMVMSPIYNLVDNSSLKVKAGVAERFMADITLGTPVYIGFDAFPEMNIQSKVSFISKSIQPDNRTFEIEVNLSDPERRLAPEMIANLKLLRRSFSEKIVVPLDAMIESEKGRHVFIAEDNKAVQIDIKILAVQEDSALVEGLKLNQNLIVVGQRELSAGDLLDIVE
jgi:membrane fusion protein (multidrug efflux system)